MAEVHRQFDSVYAAGSRDCSFGAWLQPAPGLFQLGDFKVWPHWGLPKIGVPFLGVPLRGFYSTWGIKRVPPPPIWEMPIQSLSSLG